MFAYVNKMNHEQSNWRTNMIILWQSKGWSTSSLIQKTNRTAYLRLQQCLQIWKGKKTERAACGELKLEEGKMTHPHNASCLKNKFGKRYVFHKDLKTLQLESRVHTKREQECSKNTH